jgi:hypothetical protein
MKNKDTILLEEAYELIQLKNCLLSEGYSQQEVDRIIEEKTWKDWLKAGLLATTLATTGLGNAKGYDAVTPDDIKAAASRIPGQEIRIDNTPANEINKKLDAHKRSSDRRSGVTSYDVATSEFTLPGSTGYQPREVRDNNRIFGVQKNIDVLDYAYAPEEFWLHVDDILDLLDRQAHNNNSYAKPATDKLRDIDTQLNKTGKLDDATAKTILDKIQKDVGDTVTLINKQNYNADKKQPTINQQQLLTYVVFKDVGTGQEREPDTIGYALRSMYFTNVDMPNKKEDLLKGSNFNEVDKKQFKGAKVGVR